MNKQKNNEIDIFDEINVNVTEEDVVIKLSIDAIVSSQKNRFDDWEFIISDKKAMAEYLAKNIKTFGSQVWMQELGGSDFINLVDSVIGEAYVDGKPWITSKSGE